MLRNLTHTVRGEWCEPGLQLAVSLDQRSSEGSDRRAATATAAHAGADHRGIEFRVHAVDQEPRTPIAHDDCARRLRQGARVCDRLQQADLADTDRAAIIEVDPEAYLRRLWARALAAAGG
jgi:hypothetical protein